MEELSELGLNLDTSAPSSSLAPPDIAKAQVSSLVGCITQLASQNSDHTLHSQREHVLLREEVSSLQKDKQ